ncbi:MAG TPA: DNA polymerase I [Candidatus Saccharimonadales bacterium]|nr:DNA polymerase I [Candidatus Saccharimonadales bacterium]
MSERLVIIDGKSVFYRGYYAMPNLSTKDGTPTGGVYGFAVMALEIIKRLKPNYVAVAWDKRHTNIRSRLALYPQYKGNRKPAPPDFYEQVPILHDLLNSLGWPIYEADDYEADDLMGAFAKQAGEKDIESYLVSSDLDLLQLVNKHTHIYTLKKGLTNIEEFSEESFFEKYGVDAHQWVDVKALKGDSSDNIPGVAGVGEKTALELIKTYKTLDGIYEHLDDIKPTVKAKLEKDKDMAYLSQKLITLMVDAPIEFDFEKAKLHDGVTPEFVAMLRKLEFRNLLRQVETAMSRAEIAEAEKTIEEHELPPINKKKFEASDYKPGEPRLIALNPEGTTMWVSPDKDHFSVLPILESGATDDSALPLLKDLSVVAYGEGGMSDEAKEMLKVVMNGPVIGHDLKTIFRSLLAEGVEWDSDVEHDTRIAAFILNSLERSRELSDLRGITLDMNDPAQVTSSIWEAYKDQKLEFDQAPDLLKVAQEQDFPMIKLLATIEHRGIRLDSEYLAEMGKKFDERIREFEQKIYELAGTEFNIASPSQLGNVLFDTMGLPTQGIKKGKTGYSTGASELDKLRGLHPIIDLITTYREYTKLKSTYIDPLPRQVDKEGKLHTTFALDVAATGRLSSNNPNLQNIPTRTEMGKAIRTAFVPAEGNVFVSADYSQFELRLAAVMAEDNDLLESFNKDEDIHAKTAAEVLGIPLDQVTKEQRRDAKVVNFGILYGMSPHGLSAATGMTREEAKVFIEKYFELRAPVRKYMDETVEQALKDGYVATIFGRRRPTPDLKSSNFMVREGAKRAAINMPIQGTEADLMKFAMLGVEKNLGDLGQQLLQIHDSILVECPAANADKVAKVLKDTMEGVYKLPVTLKVDVSTGKNWGEL